MNPRKHKILLFYQLFIALIALISILLLLFDCAHAINLSQSPYVWIDRSIWAILVADYFTRLAIAKDKIQFFKKNIWDLLSIIPTNSIFTLFRFARVARVFHMLRVLRLLRLVGLTVRLKRFFHTDGLIYYLYLSCGILFIAAGMYSISEGVSFSTAFWWALTTVSTVGYGDVSPTTLWGRIAAVLLMVVGVSIIGLLTSTITTYFEPTNPHEVTKKEIAKLHTENKQLHQELLEIKQMLKEQQHHDTK